MKKTLVLVFTLALALVTTAMADTLVGVTTRTGNDSADWSQLGSPGTLVSSPFNATTVGGIGITGSFAGGGNGTVMQEGNNWFGNFAINDFVLWTNTDPNLPGQGPLTLALSKGVSQIGAQIQADFYGAFTAQIQAFSGNTLLGTFSESGNSTSDEDNSAIYLGIKDLSGANITSIVISLTDCAQNCTDFGINQLSLSTGQVGQVPEPGSLMLLGSGLLGLGGFARRRFSK
ncbi:MAG TPA: PEP-CTERM sorting domain-containing protein [Terriglobales bacterium]|nr:PEP-CTERM sorting domain-containing protein [Terriglobales bacterium]